MVVVAVVGCCFLVFLFSLCIHTYTCLVKKWFTTNIDWMRHCTEPNQPNHPKSRSVAAHCFYNTDRCQEVEGILLHLGNSKRALRAEQKKSEDSYLTVIVEHDKHVFFSILIRFYGWYYGMIELPTAAEIWSKCTNLWRIVVGQSLISEWMMRPYQTPDFHPKRR